MIDVLIKKAYEQQKEEMTTEFIARGQRAESHLASLHKAIQTWNGRTPIDDFRQFWQGSGADTVAKSGPASTTNKSYQQFLDDPTTQSKIGDLFRLRQAGPLDSSLIPAIKHIDLIGHMENMKLVANKPRLYVNRMLVLIFPELFTSIAKKEAVVKAAKLLDIPVEGQAFEDMQHQLRQKIDTYVNDNNLNDLSAFEQRNLAWFVKKISA